jgi:hypothetical protein
LEHPHYFYQKLTAIHHPFVSLLYGKEFNLNIFYNYNKKIPNAKDCSILGVMNPKAQVQFVQALVHAAYTHPFCAKNSLNKKPKIVGFLKMYNFTTYIMKLPRIVCYTCMCCYGLQML